MHTNSNRTFITLTELRDKIDTLNFSLQTFKSCVTGKEQSDQQEIIEKRYKDLDKYTAKRMSGRDMDIYNNTMLRARTVVEKEIDKSFKYPNLDVSKLNKKSQYYHKKFGETK